MIVNSSQRIIQWIASKQKTMAIAVVAIAIILLVIPVYNNAFDVHRLRLAGGRNIDLAINFLAENAQDGDVVFLHWAAILGFYYYFTDHSPGYEHEYPIRGREGKVRIIYGEQHINLIDYNPLFKKVTSVEGRIWVVFSHQWPSEEMIELEQRLGLQREILKEYEFGQCRVVLFSPKSLNETGVQPEAQRR
jgi:hypothetical protein